MTTDDRNGPPQPGEAGPRRLGFDRYVLDLDRGCLELDGHEVALRPKTFAVLEHLVRNPGRLVGKDELFAAVWPNLAITDDVLVQSVGELRRALGEDGARLIKTIPRRGYRLDAAVASAPLRTSPDPDPAPAPVEAAPPLAAAKTSTGDLRWVALAALAIALAGAGLWASLGSPWRTQPAAVTDRTAAPVGLGTKPAIAVLPLVGQGDDRTRDYFVDGLTQDIINALGRFSALTVMSWNAVLPYKGRPARPDEVGRGLQVGYLVEGTVLQAGGRVRVTAQLVDTGQGRVLWSARFDEALADVFALQDAITTQIVGALAVRVGQLEERRAAAKPTANLEAYEYVLRARPALQRPTRANLVDARTLLRRAIELDPKYAAAHAALAETFYVAASQGWAESVVAFLDRAEELATTALTLDDSEVRAHTVLGRIHLVRQRYPQARAEIERAIAINPNDPHGIAGRGNVLLWLGQTDAAVEALQQAHRIDPDLNPMDRFALSLGYYLQRRYELAAEQAERNVRDRAATGFSQVVLAAAYAQLGRPEDAHRAADAARRSDPTFDPGEFGSKFLNADDLAHLREGLGKAGLVGP